MSDLISRKELIKKIAHHKVYDSMKQVTFERAAVYEFVKGDMFGLVKSAPAVDVSPHWIDAEKKLPKNEVDVAAIIRYSEDVTDCAIVFRRDGNWYKNGEGRVNVTHWMPLPEPPKEE